MAKKKFKSNVLVEVELEIEESLIADVMKPEWAADFYDFETPQDVADHLAYNFARGGIKDISKLDGFADQKPEAVTIIREEWGTEF